MPRAARIKRNNAIYHIICNSISESDLFREDSDKEKYIGLLKKYIGIYSFNICSLVLMDTHLHMIIDTRGCDISSIMKSINISYVHYYNKKYSRKGPLFAGRFKSILLSTQKHLYYASLYIHKNVLDLNKWQDNIHEYPYSSLGVFLGYSNSLLDDIIYPDLVMRLFGDKISSARKIYSKKLQTDRRIASKIKHLSPPLSKSEYRSERIIYNRDLTFDYVRDTVCSIMDVPAKYILTKHNLKGNDLRAVLVLTLRKYCGYTLKSICDFIGTITQSQASKLSFRGLEILTDEKYSTLINILKLKCSASSNL